MVVEREAAAKRDGGEEHLARPSALRCRTTPRWVTTALNPVGAACTRSRPVSTAWTIAAAVSCVGIWEVP